MTDTQHPITPPAELVREWQRETEWANSQGQGSWCELFATKAAQWGADQELEACCKGVGVNPAPVPGVDFPGPDGDWGGIQELCDAQGVDPAIGIPLLVRAREAWRITHPRPIPVAEGAGVGPSDEAWQEFIEQLQHVQHVALGEGAGPRFDLVEFALEAWRSTTHPRPIPVAERLPTAADCDAKGRCWWWVAEWHIWDLNSDRSNHPRLGSSFWLPAAALPLPQ